MIDISNKLNQLNVTKNLIKESLISKGINVSEDDTFNSYAEKIDNMPAGLNNNYSYHPKTYNPSSFAPGICNYIEEINVDGIKMEQNETIANEWEGMENVLFPNLKKITLTNATIKSGSYIAAGNRDLEGGMLKSLKTIKLLNCNVAGYWHISGNCSALETIDLTGTFYPGYNYEWCYNVSSNSGIISNCPKLSNITFSDNWGKSLPTYYTMIIDLPLLTHETLLDLMNKLYTITDNNARTIKIASILYDKLSPDEIAIAQNKGWTVTKG